MPPKRNGFFNFMAKRRKDLEREGKSFPGGWREVSLAVAHEWEQMSIDAKSKYLPTPSASPSSKYDWEKNSEVQQILKSGSPNYNADGNMNPERPTLDELIAPGKRMMRISSQEGKPDFNESNSFKKNTLGEPINAQRNLTKKVLCYEEYLEKQIKKVLLRDNIPEMVFILVSCNTWCTTYDKKCIPSEIALLAFSMRSGVFDQYSTLIDPRHIPPGLGYEASVNADKLLLPSPPFDEQYQNFTEILKCLLEFIAKYKNERDPGFLFCLRKDRKMIYSSLQWLCDNTESENKFELYPYEFLVMNLSKIAVTDAVMREHESEDCCSLPSQLDSILSGSFKAVHEEAYFASVSGFTDRCSRCEPFLPKPQNSRNGVHFEKTVFNSEERVLLCIDRLLYGSLDFLACLHHMVYLDAVHHCALNRLNRYAFQTLDLLVLNFGVKPVKGVNYIDTYSTLGEKEKRQQMLENWGLHGKEYPNYKTPQQREEQRALKIAEILKNQNKDLAEMEPQYISPLFRKQETLPEYVAIRLDHQPLHTTEGKLQSSVPTAKTGDQESTYLDWDDDWTYVPDHSNNQLNSI